MIMVGKIVVSIIWVFWMMAISSAEGQVIGDNSTSEYNPT